MKSWISVNYYELLGVPHDATTEDIRRAYKQAARKHHPDAGGSSEDFQKISEAYAILGNPEQKKRYDGLRELTGANVLTGEAFLALFTEIFQEGFHEGVEQWKKGKLNPERGHDIKATLTIHEKELSSFPLIKTVTVIHRTGCNECLQGCIKCDEGWITTERTVQTKIPNNIKNGQKIKVLKAGGEGLKTNGDLYLQINITPASDSKKSEPNAGNKSESTQTEPVANSSKEIFASQTEAGISVETEKQQAKQLRGEKAEEGVTVSEERTDEQSTRQGFEGNIQTFSPPPPPRKHSRRKNADETVAMGDLRNPFVLNVKDSQIGNHINFTTPFGDELTFEIPVGVQHGQLLRINTLSEEYDKKEPFFVKIVKV